MRGYTKCRKQGGTVLWYHYDDLPAWYENHTIPCWKSFCLLHRFEKTNVFSSGVFGRQYRLGAAVGQSEKL
jgi:hypothetical protein